MKENKYRINKAQQEIIKGKWFSFGATEHTKESQLVTRQNFCLIIGTTVDYVRNR